MQTSVSTSVQEAIHMALMKWIEAVESRKPDLLPEVVAQDNDLVWIGTTATDWMIGYTELEEAMYAQNEVLQNISISVSGEAIHFYPQTNFAWATNHWRFRARTGKRAIDLPIRCTWIFEKRAPGWRIVHFHKSVGM